MVTLNSKSATKEGVAVVFLASDVNRFSINALTGAIERDPHLPVRLAFLHPRSASSCLAEIEQLVQEVGPSGTVVVAFSFMSSALVTTSRLLKELQQGLADLRSQILFVAGGPHASGD